VGRRGLSAIIHSCLHYFSAGRGTLTTPRSEHAFATPPCGDTVTRRYGMAAELAARYKLPLDIVRCAQWEDAPITRDSIQVRGPRWLAPRPYPPPSSPSHCHECLASAICTLPAHGGLSTAMFLVLSLW